MSIGVTDEFNRRAVVSRDIMSMDFSGGARLPSVGQTPIVTDIARNKTFHMPDVQPAGVSSVRKKDTESIDTTEMRSRVGAVKSDYMATDALIKTTIRNAMIQEAGAENAGKTLRQLVPDGGSTKLQAAATMFDPTGIAGSIYAVLDAVHGEMKALPNAKLNEILEVTLNRLRQASHTQEHGDMNGARKLVPEALDFSELNVAQLRAFLERDPARDPVMREAQEKELALDDVEENNAVIRGHDHREHREEKLIAAADRGDAGGVQEFTDEPFEAGMVLAGAEIESLPAAAVVFQAGSLADLRGVEADRKAIASLRQEWEKVAAATRPAEQQPRPSEDIEFSTASMGISSIPGLNTAT